MTLEESETSHENTNQTKYQNHYKNKQEDFLKHS